MEAQHERSARSGCSRAGKAVLARNWAKSNPLEAACAIAGGLFIAYHAGILAIDAFEWLLRLGVIIGANPFGWSL